MHHQIQAFSIPDIRDFVPKKVKPWILFTFFVIYQFSGGVYLAAVTEMSSSISLMREDIMMAGYSSLVGLALTFTIMFRLKFRFSTKNALIITAGGLIVCNLICMHTQNVPLLVITSFVAGIFRMWGTFTCNTNIQLWITPKRDMAVWFCYIELCVQGFLLLSGLLTVYVAFLTKWEYMHWFIIGMLLLIIMVTFLAFRHYRSMPKLPLWGIDWMGAILWAVSIISIIFIFNYGSYLDWFDSEYIWFGCFLAITTIALNIWRASFIRHPFIENKTWRFRNVWLTLILFIIIEFLVSPSHLFEHLFAETILGYDSLNLISLNWIALGGIIIGAIFSYRTFALLKWKFKTMTVIGFSFLTIYLISMYLVIDYNLPKEMLFGSLFIRGLGYVIVDISLITALTVVPFQQFFQTLSIQAFVSACTGALIGNSILEVLFKHVLKKNQELLAVGFDNVNYLLNKESLNSIYEAFQKQAILVSMKEIYGWLSLAAMFCLLLFITYQSSLRPKALHPKFSTIRKAVKHQLKIDKMSNN